MFRVIVCLILQNNTEMVICIFFDKPVIKANSDVSKTTTTTTTAIASTAQQRKKQNHFSFNSCDNESSRNDSALL